MKRKDKSLIKKIRNKSSKHQSKANHKNLV